MTCLQDNVYIYWHHLFELTRYSSFDNGNRTGRLRQNSVSCFFSVIFSKIRLTQSVTKKLSLAVLCLVASLGPM